MTVGPYDALVVVSFGGPEGPDDVLPFLERVTAGREIPRDRLETVGAHYQLFGGISPINAQNRALIAAIESELEAEGLELPVYWGNRNWHPLLADTIGRMRADGVERAAGFVTSAFSSFSGCRQYLVDIAAARNEVGAGAPPIDKLRVFWDHPGFLEPQADRLQATLAALAADRRSKACVLFTAHSIPQAMAAGCDYEAQLAEASGLVGERAGGCERWEITYQSRSGPPSVPWLEPDIGERIRELAADGVEDVVVVPIGFVSDHMEVIYDLDTEAAATAADLGVGFHRVPTVGTDPAFVSMVRELVLERADPTAPRRSLARTAGLGLRPDTCPVDCCRPPDR